jgi:hypothetical protein
MSYGCKPGSGISGRAFVCPIAGSGGKSLLQSLFSQVEGSGDTNQYGDDSSVLFFEDPFQCLASVHEASIGHIGPIGPI